jgi:calcineurin-like phosphoesterase family protein
MNETIIERHNRVVRSEDVVVHLGDFAWKRRYVEGILARLNGEHILFAGNHDKCWLSERLALDYKFYGFKVVTINPGVCILGYEGLRALAFHLPPITSSNVDARYAEHRPVVNLNKTDLVLCGHVHERFRHYIHSESSHTKNRVPVINVGVDQWNFAPVSEEQLVEYYKEIVQCTRNVN